MPISTITARVKKHVYTANGFDIFSIKPLLNDPEYPVTTNEQYGTLTIKGSNLKDLEEGEIYTFGVTPIADSLKYKDSYQCDMILRAYPNVTDQQIVFINTLLSDSTVTNMDTESVWRDVKQTYQFQGESALVEMLENLTSTKTESDSDQASNTSTDGMRADDDGDETDVFDIFEDVLNPEANGELDDDVSDELDDNDDITLDVGNDTATVDLIKYFVEILKIKVHNSPALSLLRGLQPFSPIAQYLIDQKGVSQNDALTLVNTQTTSLKNFKACEDNIFCIYHNGTKMPIDALIRVQQILNPASDFTPANPFFLDSAIRYYLESNLMENSNDYLTKVDLANCLQSSFALNYDWDTILDNYSPQRNAKFKVCKINGELYFTPNSVFFDTKKIHQFFLDAADSSIESTVDLTNLQSRFDLPFEPNEEQCQFIQHSLTSKMTLLTGKPGTGKSGTIAVLTKILLADRKKLELLAPTAKAAQQLITYSGQPARTIHSWLASNKDVDPLTFDTKYLIMDEMSMADEELCAEVLTLIKSINAVKGKDDFVHVIWSGDVAQLLPVGPGAPFRDALILYPDMMTRLTKIYRQSNSELIDVLQLASTGDFQLTDLFKNDGITHVTSRVAYMQYKGPEQIANVIDANIVNYSPENYEPFGVISPVNRVVNEVNTAIQAKLNPITHKPSVSKSLLPGQSGHFVEGDPIVLSKSNEYISVDKIKTHLHIYGVLTYEDILRFERTNTTPAKKFSVQKRFLETRYNGDNGFVSKVLSDKAFIVTINVPGGTDDILIHTDHLTFSNVELAYVLTIHKAQGSQYKNVIYVNVRSRPEMSSQNMVYTAMSRAQESVMIFSNSYFSNIVQNRSTLWPVIFQQKLKKVGE